MPANQKYQAADPERQWAVDAIALFSALVHARYRNIFSAAAEAEQELRDLGVIVRFGRQPSGQGRIHRVGGRGR